MQRNSVKKRSVSRKRKTRSSSGSAKIVRTKPVRSQQPRMAAKRSSRMRLPDPALLISVTILVFTSLVIIYSASSTRANDLLGDSSFYLYRQLARVLIGLAGLILFSRIKYQRLRFLGTPLLVLSIVGLLALLIPGLVEPVKGARRAISLAGHSFQPAEFAKFALIIFLAHSVSREGNDIRSWPGYLRRLFIICGISALVILQPDFSTGLMIAVIGIFVLFLGGTKLGYIMLTGIVALPAAYKIALSEPYRAERVNSYITGILHPEQVGHQVNQSLIGLGDGGLFGLGIGMSHQKQFFLPEPFTDFVFSILGEELGFIGTAATVLLFIIIAVRGYKIARSAPDDFGFALGGGITFALVAYALVNLMVVTGLLPVSGLPLPFLTYGGSSLIFTMMMVGILLNISRQSEEDLKPNSFVEKPRAKN